MLSESVDTSTRKYGVSQLHAAHTLVVFFQCPDGNQNSLWTLQNSHLGEKACIHCWKLNLSHHGKAVFNTDHSCMKMPTHLTQPCHDLVMEAVQHLIQISSYANDGPAAFRNSKRDTVAVV